VTSLPATRAEVAPPVVAPPPGNPRFPLFDSLRAIAAISILVLHTASLSGVSQHAFYGAVLDKLHVGVTVFFVLSGFLLYRPFFRARYYGVEAPRIRDYARRRLLRLVPAYWVALTVTALALQLPAVLSGRFWVYYSFLQVYAKVDVLGGLPQAWSLAVEASFYAALPLYVVAMRRLSRGWSARAHVRTDISFLAIMGLAALGARQLTFDTSSSLPNTLAGEFDWFAIGMVLAVASVAWEMRTAEPWLVRFVARRPGVCWLAALAAFLAIGTVVQPHRAILPEFTPVSFFFDHVLAGVVALFLVLPAVFGDRAGGWPRRVLRWRILAWLGVVSYGIFLWQRLFIDKLHDWRADAVVPGSTFPPLTAASLVLTVGAAALSYYVIERPILRYKDPPGRRRPAVPRAVRRERPIDPVRTAD